MTSLKVQDCDTDDFIVISDTEDEDEESLDISHPVFSSHPHGSPPASGASVPNHDQHLTDQKPSRAVVLRQDESTLQEEAVSHSSWNPITCIAAQDLNPCLTTRIFSQAAHSPPASTLSSLPWIAGRGGRQLLAPTALHQILLRPLNMPQLVSRCSTVDDVEWRGLAVCGFTIKAVLILLEECGDRWGLVDRLRRLEDTRETDRQRQERFLGLFCLCRNEELVPRMMALETRRRERIAIRTTRSRR